MNDVIALQHRAIEIQQKYARLNQKDGHSAWTVREFMLGFVGDVGDLAKLVMAKENLRHIDNADAKLSHELGDCLWSLLVIAKQYNINLEDAFLAAMNELEQRIAA